MKIEKTVFANMCMIYDDNGNVVVQNRGDSKWPGIAFPGGHVEAEESFTDAVIREVNEETGLTVKEVQCCGIKDWTENGMRHVILLYKTNKFSGELISSDEGEVKWVNIDDLSKLNLADGMDITLQVFLNDNLSELFFYKENNGWKKVLK